MSDLFPGLRETVENAIEKSLLAFEEELEKQKRTAKGRELGIITRKLEWLTERRTHR